MKKTLLLFALFFTSLAFSQFVLDNTYFYTQGVQRIVLENSGEKYYYVNYQTGVIQFFNANHTPWKSVMLPLPSQNWTLGITHISETKINADDNLEIAYSTYSSPNTRQCKIINELGTVLLSVENCESLRLDEKEGVADKIISSTGVVYSIPGLTAEHIYPVINYANVKRVKLENSGEKYYVLDVVNSLAVLYNADHTFWKSIALPKPDGYTMGGIGFLSENQVNSDNLIEVSYGYYIPGSDPIMESKVINENGVVLATIANTSYVFINAVEDLPNKLFADTSHYTDAGFVYETQVYALTNFSLEYTYSGNAVRVNLENSGEKYYTVNNNPGTNDIVVYNSNHTPWKTIPALSGDGNPYATIESVFISETKIDSDDALELIYTVSSNLLNGGHHDANIIKDDGTVILAIEGGYDVQLSEFPNLPTKLISHSRYEVSFNTMFYTSTVYDFDEAFGVEDFNKSSISIAPNPAQSTINLLSKTTIVEANLFDMRGVSVNQSVGTDIQTINVENLASGIYLLQLNDAEGATSTHKIVISH